MKWFIIVGGVVIGYVVIKSLSATPQNISTYIPSPVYSANLQSSNPIESLSGNIDTNSNNSLVNSTLSSLTGNSNPTNILSSGNLNNDIFNTINSLSGNLAQNQQTIDAQLNLLQTANSHVENLITTGGGLALALTSGLNAPEYSTGVNAVFNPNSNGGFSVSSNYDVSNSLKEISTQLEQTKINDANILNSTIADWKNRYDNLNNQFSDTMNGNTAQINSLNNQVNQVTQSKDSISSNYDSLNANYNNLSNDLKDSNSRYSDLKNNYDSVVSAFQNYVLQHR